MEEQIENWAAPVPQVPPMWEAADFDDVFNVISTSGKKIKQKEYLRQGEIPIIDQGAKLIGGYTNDESSRINISDPVIVFGDHTRCFKIISFDFAPGADGVKILSPRDDLDATFLLYACTILKLPSRGYSRHFSFLQKSKIPLAPLNEQKRIVSKIEELFSDLEQGEAAIRKVQKLLARYRQSVLKAAVTGELTKDWREANQHRLEPGETLLKRILQSRREQWQGRGKYQEPAGPDTSSLPAIREGWVWASLEQICGAIVDCPHSTPRWTEEGVICVRTTEFLPGKLKLDNVRYVSEATYQHRIARLEPNAGDVLYSREGGILGIACIIPEGAKLCMGQRMMLMRASVSGEYLMHVLNSPLILSLVALKTGGSASPHLNVRDIKLFPVPFPSRQEQLEIVSRIDDIFSQISTLENWCGTELARSNNLRQSILKDAFSGKLVPQDPVDEPASELLKRIQTERERQSTGKTQRGGRKQQSTLREMA